ncbi:Uncharacterised protein [Vibrio cholerae]|nr:Uncharacterised protein [Vibrio cholerae]
MSHHFHHHELVNPLCNKWESRHQLVGNIRFSLPGQRWDHRHRILQ